MAEWKIKTKNQIDIDKKPKVYFTCHTDDFEKYFDKICEHLFKIYDCAICYSEDINEAVTKDKKDILLYTNRFFIVPVTRNLLTTPNSAMDEDILYAKEKDISILPIVMEADIEELYLKSDNFGEFEYLHQYNCNINDMPFEERLKNLLDTVLIDVEIKKYTKAANISYIMSEFDKVITYYEHIYSLSCKLLGENNTKTTSALSFIAHINRLIGDKGKTLEFDKRRYEVFCRVYGEKDPETIKTLNELGHSFFEFGNKEKALETFKKSYDISYEVLGEEHPETVGVLNGVAYATFLVGNKKEALEYYKKLYPLSCRILGNDHKITLSADRAITTISKMLDEE